MLTSRGWPLSSKKTRARAVGVRVADGEELDDQRLAFLDFDADFLADLLAVEENRRREHAGVGVLLLVGGELLEDLRIEQIREHVALDRRLRR